MYPGDLLNTMMTSITPCDHNTCDDGPPRSLKSEIPNVRKPDTTMTVLSILPLVALVAALLLW